jgi:tetratricopeptide (TPR) repeat protein
VSPRCLLGLTLTAVSLFLSSVPVAFAAAADAAPTKGSECTRAWAELLDQSKGDPKVLGEKWQAMRSQCEGTGVYEFHWASVLELSGRRAEAIDYLSRVLKTDVPTRGSLEVQHSSMLFSQALLEHGADPGVLAPIHAGMQAILREHPDSSYALGENARQLNMLGKYAEAYSSADKALGLDHNSWAAAMSLIEAGSQSGHCKDVRGIIVPAIKTSEDRLLGNAGFMYAAVRCYLEGGATDTAESALKALVQRAPEVRQDSQFQRLVNALNDAKRARSSADSR